MISPYVRRRRLAAELVALREAAGLTHVELAKRSKVSQSTLSRLETGQTRPNVGAVIKILDVLDVTPEQWETVVAITHEAGQEGWWEREAIDARQARYADLEAGAKTIREYPQAIIPGLLQTAEFMQALSEYEDASLVPGRSTPESVVRARAGRQRMLRRPGGPTYDVIVDELSIRRPSVPPKVLAAQLRHLANSIGDRITVRILPIDLPFSSLRPPRDAFSLYTYRDPGDPVVVAVDTVTADLILTEPEKVQPYEKLFARLSETALPVAESAEFLARAADELEGTES